MFNRKRPLGPRAWAEEMRPTVSISLDMVMVLFGPHAAARVKLWIDCENN